MVEQYTQMNPTSQWFARLDQLDRLILSPQPVIEQICIDLMPFYDALKVLYPQIKRMRPLVCSDPLAFSIVRLDRLHPFISGNKWPKLRGWFYDTLAKNKKQQEQTSIQILTSMGGAHSNHLLAFAAAAQALGIACRCYVRANGLKEQLISTETTRLLHYLGADIRPVSRSHYREMRTLDTPFFCPEGGKSESGAKSVALWVQRHAALFSGIETLYTGVGTGTWLAGLICGFSGAKAHQQKAHLIGIPAVAGQKWLAENINALCRSVQQDQAICSRDFLRHRYSSQLSSSHWSLDWEYPKKGAGPVDPEVLAIMTRLFPFPVDPVYLPRVLYSVILEHLKGNRQKSMVIHSGGLRPSMIIKKEGMNAHENQ